MRKIASHARWIARLWLLACFVAALLAVACGCNVVALQQARIEHTMRAAGLEPKDQRLGADTVRYWSGGRGPTVVLVHGFGGSGMWLWYPQVEDLARDHRVIVPDLLWFGESRSDARDFSIDHQVRAVEALLDHLGERETDVVGVSYGGLVAHELASDTDGVGQLLGLAYFDPPWVPGFALEQTLTSLYPTYRDERVALLDSLLHDMDGLVARPVTLRARTMVIWGRQDPVFPLQIGERRPAACARQRAARAEPRTPRAVQQDPSRVPGERGLTPLWQLP